MSSFNDRTSVKMTMSPLRPSMMRPVLAFLTLLALTAPVVSAVDPVAFSARQGCRVTSVPMDLPDCAVEEIGGAAWVGCGSGSCTFTVDLSASATGLPAGVRSLTARVVGDERVVVCSATSIGTSDVPLSCSGEVTVTVVVPTGCRLVLVETVGESNRVVSGVVMNEIRICTNGAFTAR